VGRNKNKRRANDIIGRSGFGSPPSPSAGPTTLPNSVSGSRAPSAPLTPPGPSAADEPAAVEVASTVPDMLEQAIQLEIESPAIDAAVPEPDGVSGKETVEAPAANTERLREAIRSAANAKRGFQMAEAQSKASLEAVEQRDVSLQQRQGRLDEREKGLQEWHGALSAKELEFEHARLLLVKREEEAKAGFPQLLAGAREAVERSVQARELGLREIEEQAHKQLEEAKQQMAQAGDARLALKRAQEDLALDRENLDERIALASRRAEQKLQSRVERLDQDLEDAKRREMAARDWAKLKEGTIQELEKRLAPVGAMSIEQLAVKCAALSAQLKARDAELTNRPDADAVAELRRQAGAVDGLRRELEQIKADNAALRSRLAGLTVAATELENQRDLVRAYENRARVLKEANTQLEADVTSKLDQSAHRNPFSELARMDQDVKLQAPISGLRKPENLKAIVQEVKERVAMGPHPLYYDDATIRCFIAGMAMSRLHLLQGISGTGKTSLPRAVGKALGGDVEIVPVQAGWRDRQDLLGYFNAFDKRYHEPAFVQALYRAQCPKWNDRVFVIVLDEMNLSYFEQYGADLNSEIEQPPSYERRFQLMDSLPPIAPRLLRDGRFIAWPDNVWIAGTANHDETTKDFADKTYDRAHTMELPPGHPQPGVRSGLAGGAPISCSGLRELFEAAVRDQAAMANKANGVLAKLKDQLQLGLRVGWGNRLDGPKGQMARFVSAVVASGGTCDEALDHILATKLLRKLRGKHEVRLKTLEQFRDTMVSTWKQSFGEASQPAKSRDLLAELIQSRRFEESEGA